MGWTGWLSVALAILWCVAAGVVTGSWLAFAFAVGATWSGGCAGAHKGLADGKAIWRTEPKGDNDD